MAVAVRQHATTATQIGTGGSGNIGLPDPPAPVRTTATVIVTDYIWKPNEGETAEIEVGAKGMSLEALNQMLNDQPGLVGRKSVATDWPIMVDDRPVQADQYEQTIVMPGQTVTKRDP